MDDGGFFLAISLFNIQNMRRQFPFILARSSLDTYVYDYVVYVYKNPNPKIKNRFKDGDTQHSRNKHLSKCFN